jgi:hypothetical protein
MVRKIGSNTPSVEAPQLYDISGDMYAQMGQNVQQAFASSSQALSNLNTAYAANAQRQMAHFADMEDLRANQAKAEQMGQGGGGLVQGIGEVAKGLVGGFAVLSEIEARKQAAEAASQEAQAKAAKEERAYQLDVAKLEQQQYEFETTQEFKNQQYIDEKTMTEGKTWWKV